MLGFLWGQYHVRCLRCAQYQRGHMNTIKFRKVKGTYRRPSRGTSNIQFSNLECSVFKLEMFSFQFLFKILVVYSKLASSAFVANDMVKFVLGGHSLHTRAARATYNNYDTKMRNQEASVTEKRSRHQTVGRELSCRTCKSPLRDPCTSKNG